jgi:hypothetical protein
MTPGSDMILPEGEIGSVIVNHQVLTTDCNFEDTISFDNG